MPFSIDKIFPPHSAASMLKEASRNTICEMLRQVYTDINAERYEDAKYKIRIAVTMAKRMSSKLKSYKLDYDKNFFPKKD